MLLELNEIRKSYGKDDSRVQVLKGISLGVEKGEFCVLLGPSGSGKSTLLNIIGGIDTADSGEILIDGEMMSRMNEKKLTRYRRQHLGYVFQMYILSRRPLDVNELLNTLGLYDHRDKLPGQLSGGQQQRTSIGRAIVKNPDILLCDEPTGALDYNTSREILQLIERVSLKYHTTVVMVTHNEAIGAMADTIIRLRDGMIRERLVNEIRMPAEKLEW